MFVTDGKPLTEPLLLYPEPAARQLVIRHRRSLWVALGLVFCLYAVVRSPERDVLFLNYYLCEPLNILFVGNSFTYGPPAWEVSDPQRQRSDRDLKNLPRLFKLVAESLGHKINQAEDTIGGCTLYMHRPHANPDGCTDPAVCQTIDLPRVSAAEECTVDAGIPNQTLLNQYHPCPQLLGRQPFGSWDVLVVQDQSMLPAVQAARDILFLPTVAEFASVVKRQGTQERRRRRARPPVLASYMTWAYYNGSRCTAPGCADNFTDSHGNLGPAAGKMGMAECPGGNRAGCFPEGLDLDTLSRCNETEAGRAFKLKMGRWPCQSYALARGYAAALAHGADVLVPAGLAQAAARGAPPIPADCKAAIDGEYDGEYGDGDGPLGALLSELPLRAADADARWRGARAQRLFNHLGSNYTSAFCDDGCHIDHHPSILAQYLNACVFYATLFGRSPVGAAYPDGDTVVDGMKLPAILDAEDAEALQRIAARIVLPEKHMRAWWKGKPWPLR